MLLGITKRTGGTADSSFLLSGPTLELVSQTKFGQYFCSPEVIQSQPRVIRVA